MESYGINKRYFPIYKYSKLEKMEQKNKTKSSNFLYTLLCAVIGKSPLRSKTRTENLNEIIISEIKKDRIKLLKAISDSHLYDFDDVSEETPISLSNDWNSDDVRFNT
jgi:hypothetical protein